MKLNGYRHDQALDQLQKLRRDANGYLHFEARAARTGVLSYADVGGPRELTEESVLFDPESMQSMIGVPVTDEHPPETLLDAGTATSRQLGSVYSVRRDGDYLVVGGVITDGALATKVESGAKAQVSPGYRFGAAARAGVWSDGERYDSVQIGRLYNHLSIVPVGRCSRTCAGGDCMCAVRRDGRGDAMKNKGKKVQVRLDGQMFTVSGEMLEKLLADKSPEEQADFWKQLALGASDEADDAGAPEPDMGAGLAGPPPMRTDAPKGDAAKELEAVRSRLDAAEARANAAERALERQAKSASEAVSKSIGDHIAAIERARLVKGARFDGAGMAPVEIDRAVLSELYPEEKDAIAKYSAAEVAADIRLAFHPDRGDVRVRAARENMRADGVPVVVARADGQDEWSKAVERERKFNGQAS